MPKKQYSGTAEYFEQKLGRVMERLGVEKYQCDWSQGRNGSSCWVEMCYGGSVYRFENSTNKSAACGRGLTFASDLFAAVVYSLEGLARAVEQGIFTLDMLLAGVPALPPASPPLEICFQALGFKTMPSTREEVGKQYKHMAKTMHPDAGGDPDAFAWLTEHYNRCIELLDGA